MAAENQLRGWVPGEVRKLSPSLNMMRTILPRCMTGSSMIWMRSSGRLLGERDMPSMFSSKSWLKAILPSATGPWPGAGGLGALAMSVAGVEEASAVAASELALPPAPPAPPPVPPVD